MMADMLTLYRRHEKHCPHTKRSQVRCQCPVWIDGMRQGQRINHTMDTRDMAAARRELTRIESGSGTVTVPQLNEMLAAWLEELESRNLAAGTIEKHRQDVRAFTKWAAAEGISTAAACDLAAVRRYRDSWGFSAASAVKRIERTRQMWRFWIDHQWCTTNPAAKIKPPKCEPRPKKPYEDWEIAAMLAAVDASKRMDAYERRRMTAWLHVMRYTGMRVSDAVQLTPAAVRDGRVLLHQAKTGAPVSIPIPPLVENALEAIRDGNKPYFWSGEGTVRTRTANFSRTLLRIGKAAKVAKPSPHRFRTTFAVALLSRGVAAGRVAKLLGHKDSTIVEKHYAPWVQVMQDALEADVRRAYSQEFATPARPTPAN